MSFKVYNPKLCNTLVAISTETVQFDADGVGTIESELLYNRVLELANFRPMIATETGYRLKTDGELAIEEAAKAAAEAEERAKLIKEQEDAELAQRADNQAEADATAAAAEADRLAAEAAAAPQPNNKLMTEEAPAAEEVTAKTTATKTTTAKTTATKTTTAK